MTFSVDAGVEARPATLDRTAFAPSRADETGSITLSYHADEPLKLTVRAWRRSDVALDTHGAIASFNAGAVPVRRLAEGIDIPVGDGTLAWDGHDDSGSFVADGTYVFDVSYTDGCGNAKSELPFLVVADHTPPVVAISVPAAAASVTAVVDVRGSVNDASLAAYVLEFGTGSDPQSWTPIASGTQDVADGSLGSWNTLGLAAGAYTLRLRAADAVGNSAETRVPVTVAASLTLVASLEAAPPIFSPNNDGQLDQSALRFSLAAPATVTLTIYQDAVKVRTLLAAVPLQAGAASVAWDGRGDGGTTLPDGVYTAQIDAATAAGSQQTVSIPVAIDTAAPTLSIAQPAAGFARGIDTVVGTIADANLQDYTVTLRSLDSGATVTLDSGTDVRNAAPLGSLANLAEGRYEIDVVAHDRAGNQQSLAVPFELDNTPPRVAITAPAAGTVLGMKASPYGITGTIDERNLLLFQLNLAQGPPPAPVTLASGAALPAGAIGTLDVSRLVDGTYTLQLVAQDKAGWSTTASVDVLVDKTPPTAAITAPVDNDFLRIGSDIKGTANDANFKQYKLEIAPGPKATASRFSEVVSSASAVDNALLGRLAALPPDGVQTLRLTVTDKADNASTFLVQVTVDTTPPAVPAGLAAKVQNRQDVALTWTANTEADLAGYYVYRDGGRITATPVATNAYTDAGVADGDHLYAVSAVDRAGNESARSPTVTARVSLTTPTAIITAPPRNGTVVIGSAATSGRDRRERSTMCGWPA